MHGTVHEGRTANKYAISAPFFPTILAKLPLASFLCAYALQRRFELKKKRKGLSHCSVASYSLRSRCFEVVGARKNRSFLHPLLPSACYAGYCSVAYCLTLREVKASDYHCLQDIQRTNYR